MLSLPLCCLFYCRCPSPVARSNLPDHQHTRAQGRASSSAKSAWSATQQGLNDQSKRRSGRAPPPARRRPGQQLTPQLAGSEVCDTPQRPPGAASSCCGTRPHLQPASTNAATWVWMGAARGRLTSAKQGVVATASSLRGRAGPEGRWRQRDWRRDMAWRTRTSTARITARPPRGATYRARTSRSRRLRARRTASGFPRCPHIVGSQMPRRSGPPTRPCSDSSPGLRRAATRRPGRGVLKAQAARRRTSAGSGLGGGGATPQHPLAPGQQSRTQTMRQGARTRRDRPGGSKIWRDRDHPPRWDSTAAQVPM